MTPKIVSITFFSHVPNPFWVDRKAKKENKKYFNENAENVVSVKLEGRNTEEEKKIQQKVYFYFIRCYRYL